MSTTNFSILVDGSPTEYFSSNRGIRQGDHLSPFPFASAMEYFTTLLDMEFYEGNILLFLPTLTYFMLMTSWCLQKVALKMQKAMLKLYASLKSLWV